MDTDNGERFYSQENAGVSREWVHDVITLLDAAARQLQGHEVARGAIVRATSLLRKQVGSETVESPTADARRLLAWQARKLRDYVDRHIAGPLTVADLSALVRLSEAHFSRCFRHTFGEAPHAFVVRRRLELATRYMLQTDMTLSEIALRCGFSDQAHLNKRFREAIGETPAAWRRAAQTFAH